MMKCAALTYITTFQFQSLMEVFKKNWVTLKILMISEMRIRFNL